jgi:hypothetical protein
MNTAQTKEIRTLLNEVNTIIINYENVLHPNINSQMKREIFELISESEANFNSLIALQKINIRDFVIEDTIQPIVAEIGDTYGLITKLYLGEWPSFRFESETLKSKGINALCFSSSSKFGFTNMVYGLLPNAERHVEKEKSIKALFNIYFNGYSGSGFTNWIALGYFDDYRSLEDYNTLKDIQLNPSDFKAILEEKVTTMLKIIKEIS